MIRLATGWIAVAIFLFAGDSILSKSNLENVPLTTFLAILLLGVILWCAFGVIVAADHLAEMLGEPYGTLILTFSIVAIEVMLISTVMLGGGAPTIGRDTMFAVMMIVLNGVIGLSLVIGGLKHHTQDYSLPGASAYLSVIVPLVTIALILPSVTTSTDAPTLSTTQAILFAGATIVLYVIFILIQTGRHRDLFVHGPTEEHDVPDPRRASSGSGSRCWSPARCRSCCCPRAWTRWSMLSIVTFSGPRTTVLEGAVRLLVFFVYIVLVFSP
jgi:Ca2+:H+ antiporter